MAYLKPQSPLQDKASGDFFYPLTTVDQVVMPDGRRLNAVLNDSSVPTPTTSDNGKVLQVVNGSPAWTAIPSAEEAEF